MTQTPSGGPPVLPPPPSTPPPPPSAAPGPRHDRLAVHLSRKALGYLRTTATMVVLAAILVTAVGVGWSKANHPFPSLKSDSGQACVDRDVAAGDRVTPEIVTVSVLNAGTRQNLSEQTLDQLTADGFDQGRAANAPTEAKVGRVEIWTDQKRNPAVKLLMSYLGKNVKVRSKATSEPGINVVVGDSFVGVVKGLDAVKARRDSSICGP